jgi:hypothetical protein
MLLLAPLSGVLAQDVSPVQELHGSLAPGQSDVFRLKGLEKGQVLYVFMENTSGNLDPILSILPADQDLSTVLESYQIAVSELVAGSTYPLLDLPALRDQYSLAWDDDSGPGYSAALRFIAPEDGDYYLLLAARFRRRPLDCRHYRLPFGLTPRAEGTGRTDRRDNRRT